MSDEAEIMLSSQGLHDRMMEARRFGEQRAYLKCAEMAKQRARELGEEAASMPERGPEWRNALSRADQLDTLAFSIAAEAAKTFRKEMKVTPGIAFEHGALYGIRAERQRTVEALRQEAAHRYWGTDASDIAKAFIDFAGRLEKGEI